MMSNDILDESPKADSGDSVATSRSHSLLSIDESTVRRTFGSLCQPGQIVEVRVLFDGAPPWTGYFQDPASDPTKVINEIRRFNRAKGIYWTINPVDPKLWERSPNKITPAQSGQCSSDSNILRRTLFFVDLDPVRPSGVSATKEERSIAVERAMLLVDDLAKLGLPQPLIANSGNGVHLVYGTDLPTEDQGLIKSALKGLSVRYSDDLVEVDTGVHNPGRICRLYGTVARKGEDTPERPHRMSGIISAPDKLDAVTEKQLLAVAGLGDSPDEKHQDMGVYASTFDIEEFIRKHKLQVDGPKEWGEGGRIWKFKHSPMCEHHGDGPYLGQHANGALFAACHHESCKWDWHDLRAKYQPPIAPCSDIANAARFVSMHGGRVRYCHEWQKWLIWDGQRWKVDKSETIVTLAKKTAQQLLLDAKRDGRDDTYRWAKRSQGRDRLNAMVSLAQCELPIEVESLDSDGWLFNCANGTLDLRTGVLRPHNERDYLTKLCDVPYDPSAEAPLWEAFLDRIFEGDDSLIRYVQQLIGLAIVGEVIEHLLLIFYGVGANGKSVLLNTGIRVLGKDYAMKAPSQFLVASKSAKHPTELADLHGKRLVAALETEDGARLSESLVKELTGGDVIRARRMREDFWEFTPTHTLFLATNHKPAASGTDNGIWRRLKIVPFLAIIPEEEQDKELSSKLENEFPGILRWIVSGCLDWRKNGLVVPEQVQSATSDYRSDMDRLGEFIEECCELSENAVASAKELYGRYKKWSVDRGESYESQTAFGTRLRERGFTKSRQTAGPHRGSTVYTGLELSLAV